MKRSVSRKSNNKQQPVKQPAKSKPTSKSKSKSKSKDKQPKKIPKQPVKQPKPAKKEEEKKQPAILAPIVHPRAIFIGVRQEDNPRLFDIARIREDYRQGDPTITVDFYIQDIALNGNRGARSLTFLWDQQRPTEDIDMDRLVRQIELTKKDTPKKYQLAAPQDSIRIRKREIKRVSQQLKVQAKNNKSKVKDNKKKVKQDEIDKKIEEERHARAEARHQARESKSVEPPKRKRQKILKPANDDDVEMINTHQQEGEEEKDGDLVVSRKRDVKAAVKKRAKSVAVKKAKEPEPLREDVEIPEYEEIREGTESKPQLKCCQTCSNRNCIRAVNINSIELFEQCIQSKAYITSLIEQPSPEQRFTALELAIAQNRVELIEMILSQDKHENDTRMKKRDPQIAKFDTGEVGHMAFGCKVKKVQMMRGNRQGNNAFLEDPKHDHQTPVDYLMNNEWALPKCFAQDSVKIETLVQLQKSLGQEQFRALVDKALPVILRHGCYRTLLGLFELMGMEGRPNVSFWNKIYFQLLTMDKKDFDLDEGHLKQAQANPNYRLSHLAALNPSGLALTYLKENGLPIDETHANISTVHYAAVCSNSKNLAFLRDNDIDLHDEDASKRSPLLWAIEARKPAENVRIILEEITKPQSHHKDDHKKMAIHYVCQYPQDSTEILDLMLEYKAKFSQAGGWDKYTPLIYAATYGNFEAVQYLLEKVPRININKGDKYKRTPLIMAVRNGHLRIAALLIKHNAELNLPDTSENTPLHHAAAYGQLECVQLLLKSGADPSPENAWKSTPITIAMQKNHLAIVKELILSQEINIDGKDDDGRTVLSLAISNINAETPAFVHLLLTEKGADPNSLDAKGQTPLFHLVHNMTTKKRGLFQDHDELEFKIVKMLLKSGANVNIKSKEGKSPFTLSFESGIIELVKLFGGNIDLNQDPSIFFAFSGISVLKSNLHQLLLECMQNKQLEDETINYVNDHGFTPFLYYIKEATGIQQRIFWTINHMLQAHVKHINNETILEYADKHPNLQQLNNQNGAKEIFKQEITQPFNKFLQALLDQGANPNAFVLKLKQWREDQVPLGLSQVSQNTQALAVIHARRPPEKDQYVSEASGLCNAVHFLCDQKVSNSFFDFILSIKGLDLNQTNFQKMTPFFKLVKTKDIKNDKYFKSCFEKLLQSGHVDINAPDQFGCSAFWHFYSNNRFEEAFFLVDKGANINHIDNYGMFALKKELWASNLEMMKRLLEKGADPNQTDEFGRTCLHLACNMIQRKDMKETMKILMKHGADIKAVDMKKRTPAHYMFVRKNRRFEIDHFEPMHHGLTILFGEKDAQQFNILAQDTNGKTLLHYAAQRGSLESLDYLCKLFGNEQALFSIEDKWQNTPLGVALNCKQFKFAERLIEQKLSQLKGFIYDEPKPRQGGQQINNIFGNNQHNDQEDSDMEFMEVQLQDQLVKKHNKDSALNLFRYVIRNQLGEIETLFIQNEYDRIQMVIDYICEGQIGKLFQVIDLHFKDHLGAKGSILIQKNQKQQNLIHVLSRNAHLIKDIGESTKFYSQLIEEGVIPHDIDDKGQTALHHAIKSGNLHYIKFLIDVQHFDVNQVDKSGSNAINTLLKGDRILTANVKILEYLLTVGGDPNNLYQEATYSTEDEKEIYRTTSVIHAIRHESKEREHIKLILKALLKHANPSQQDSLGKDPFMYIAQRNHNNTFHFILDTLKDNDNEKIKKDNVDFQGQSFVHYIVNPLKFGSYENAPMLRHAINVGFEHDIKDMFEKTPYEYACEQKSGVLKKVFEDLQLYPAQEKQNEVVLDIHHYQIRHTDYEQDAQLYLQEIQMQLDPHKFVPCDPAGKFNEDCVVMYDDKTEQHFDAYMTRVEIGKFQAGGDYLFYRMQLVLDRSRDLPILLTRWGRIGEEGAFQKTPFSSHDAAIEEYKKIFEQKTNNKWCPKDKFHKKFRKFQLMRTNYVTLDQKNYLNQFNLENAPLVNGIQTDVIEVMKEICDVNTYMRALQSSGVDAKAMPFSNLDRKNLYDAQEVLMKLQKTLAKLETMNPRPYAENERNQLLSLREKMWYLSSRFYEFIPHEEFRNKMVPPISNLEFLNQKLVMINNLIEIEMASKILLGAHYRANEIHPLEYCVNAAGVQIEVLKSNNDEYKLIRDYALNTYVDQNKKSIRNIMRIDKPSESERFSNNVDNRVLLFHGSRISNFLGILSQALRVQPEGVKRQGNLLGQGIYFSDSLSKALQYTQDGNASQHSSKFIIVCEVALGNSKEQQRFQNNYVLEEGFQSVHGVGRQGPELDKYVILPDGVKVPVGKNTVYENRNGHDFQFNEFVVSDPKQVRMRYLVQLK